MSTDKTDERSDEMRDPTKDEYLELETKLGSAESELAAGISANDKATKDAMAAAREHTKSAIGDLRRRDRDRRG